MGPLAEQYKDELLSIKNDSKDGKLYVPEVEQWARKNSNSALHHYLEWDNERAGQEYRYAQIRKLIHLVVVTPQRKHMLVNLMIDRVTGGGYRAVDEVMANRNLVREVEAECERELKRLYSKYGYIKKYNAVWRAIEEQVLAQGRPANENQPNAKRRARG